MGILDFLFGKKKTTSEPKATVKNLTQKKLLTYEVTVQ